jgi:hypothetical protein
LYEVIDAERARLMDAEAILHCAVVAMDDGGGWGAEGPYYTGVIDTAREMVIAAINNLDSIALKAALRRADTLDREGGGALRAKDEVREKAPAYLH